MSDKFRLVMNAVDDDLLEEAFAPVKRKNLLPWIHVAIAACLMLVLGLTFAHSRNSVVTFTDLSDMGYVMKLPEDAEQIQYEILTLADSEGAQASFLIRDTEYLYQAVKTPEQQMLSDSVEAEANVLTWNSGNLDMQLLSSSSSTSVSWYIPDDQTQWYLTAKADAQEVLTTASQILRITGLDVMVAPESAGNITYNVFLLGDLTVAETTFVIDGITYAYRMRIFPAWRVPSDRIRRVKCSGAAQSLVSMREGRVRSSGSMWCPAFSTPCVRKAELPRICFRIWRSSFSNLYRITVENDPAVHVNCRDFLSGQEELIFICDIGFKAVQNQNNIDVIVPDIRQRTQPIVSKIKQMDFPEVLCQKRSQTI